jgi:hypothetical protein
MLFRMPLTRRPLSSGTLRCFSAVLAAVFLCACGGVSDHPPGGTGTGSSGGGSGGGSGGSSGGGSGGGSGGSSGGGSGGSSGGGSGSSSGGGSGGSSGGGSGSSSGASEPCPVDSPTGACADNGEVCSYPGGIGGACGTSCECENGEWGCFADPCLPPPPPACPPTAPSSSSSCAGENGLSCGYSIGTCGSEQCDCENDAWQCAIGICTPPPPPPPPACPTFPPSSNTACSADVGECIYDVNGDCNQESCNCDPYYGTWSCVFSVGCADDAGITLPP